MSSNSRHRSCISLFRRLRWVVLLFLLCQLTAVHAQDAVRPSLAGETAAQARRQTLDHIPYNWLFGPVRVRVSATVGLEYNDNINIAEQNTQDDFIFRPQVNLNALWPITQLNTLRFDIGVGYAFYASHSENNTNGILLTPGSQLSFDIFVGDFRINVHDRFSLEQDPIGEPQLSGVVDYGRFQNTAGVSVLWDLNKAVVTLGYDHYTFLATNDDFDYLDRNAEMLTASVSFAVTSTTGAGLEGSYVFNTYDRSFLNDSNTFSIGGFVETQLTSYMKLRVAAGYQTISFDGDTVSLGPFPDGSFVFYRDSRDLNDFYINALLSHRLNAAIMHSLSVGHESQLGVNSNYIQLNYVRHTVTWNVINRTLLSTEVFFEDAEDSGGFIDEHLQRYGGAVTIGYQLTQHVTLGARYQYTQKDSNVALRSYKQNRVAIDATYSF